MSKYFDKVTKKLKSIKNKEFIIAIIICIAIVAIFWIGKANTNSDTTNNQVSSQLTFEEYNQALENKITKLVSNIDGVDSASVAITYQAGVEKVYAYQTEIISNGSTTTETNQIITVNGEPIVIKELAPSIIGVAIVINGTNSVVAKINATQIVVTLLDIDSSKVQVFAYN